MSDVSDVDEEELEAYGPMQRDMYFVLYSMYRDGFERIRDRRDPWQKHDNLCFSIVISSSLDKGFYAKMDFEIPFQFPKLPIRAKLLELSPHTISVENQITQILATYPKKNLHETVITDMMMNVQDLLDKEATENEVNTQGMSLEEERAHQEALARDHARAQHEYELRMREEEEVAHEKRLSEAILKEKQRRHGQYLQESDDIDSGADQDVTAKPFRFRDSIKWFDPDTKKQIVFSAVYGPRVLVDRPDKRVTLVHPVRSGKLLPAPFVLKEIFLPDYLAPKTEMESAMDSIRTALEDCKTADHPHIVKIYAYQIEHDISEKQYPEWKITILTEQAPESSLREGLKMSGCFEPQQVRTWTQQLLRAMDFLEKLGHPHPAIHLGNVMFWSAKGDKLLVKLADGYGSALRDLVEKAREKFAAEQVSIGWLPPELVPGGEGRSSKTGIWQLGVAVLKMAFFDGLRLEEVHTSVDPLLVRDDLRDSFKDFLISVFQTMPRKRPSPSELISYQMLKEGTQAFNIPTRENLSDKSHLLRSGNSATGNSQWTSRFIEATPLGSGGFGQVFKALNITDRQFYAVKRLVCTSRDEFRAIWSEVHLLAKLNHPGVVRYYNAWQEDEDAEDSVFKHALVSQSSTTKSVRNHLLDSSTMPSREHDFMDPSMHRHIGAEYNSDDDKDGNNNETDSDDDNGSGMFGYQSPPEDNAFDEISDNAFNEISDNAFNEISDNAFDEISDNVQFGNETSSVAGEQETTSDIESTSPAQHTPARRPVHRSIMYIQMELCNVATLKDLILDGLPHRITDVFHIFRDIVEALVHIHSHGVVHRDLKPTNIFISEAGRAKIGDFGLATSHLRSESRHKNVLVAGSERGVGTQWYIAPELNDQGSGEYSSKADMFSLGVIFFQMSMPCGTELERFNYLKQISTNQNFQLPKFFEAEGHQPQGRIIASLINHDQNARPSSKELLLDPAIPEDLEDATIDRHLARFIETDPERYASIVNKIYDKAYAYTQAQDLAWQNRGHKSEHPQQLDPVTSALVNDQLRDIFRRHGAVESERDFPFPVADFYSNAAAFIDDSVVLQLPFDLTLPFARMLADPEERPLYPKNYCFGTVYRRAHRGVAPIRFPEVDYDHVSYNAKDLSFKDAEVIKVLDEVLTEHSALAPRSFIIVINHGDLLDNVLKFAQVKEEIWDNVKRELSQLNVGRVGWKIVRDQLLSPRYEISQSSVSQIEKFNFQSDIATMKRKVKSLLDEEHASRVTKTFARLDELMKFIELLGVKTSVQLAPLSNNTEQLYRGSVMFKAVESKSRTILAVGGRYDRLIETLSFNTPKGSIRSAGFRINVSVLNAYVVAGNGKRRSGKQHARGAQPLPSPVDVVVTSFDESILHSSCIEIHRNLLACGIKVEISDHYSNMAELEKYYGDSNYCFVIVRAGSRIKVRNFSKEKVDVRRSELVTYIKSELGARNAAAAEPKLARVPSSHTGEKATQRVIVCNPSHKDKKVNRSAIVDAAASAVQELIAELSNNAPIVAISTKDETLDLMCNTRLADDASWRGLKQNVPLMERQYLTTVQELLQEKADEGAKGAFVANAETNYCILYNFGKKN